MKGTYLYGIIKRDENQNLTLDGLTTVAYQSLAAVVEEKEVKDYHKLPKEETIKELISHQQTIEKIMSESPILPVKFGTILKDEGEVESVLAKGCSFLEDTLQKMEDKIELDLVCFWNEQKAAQMAFQESKKIRDYYTSEVARPARHPALGGKALAGGRDSSDGEMEDKIALGKLITGYLVSKREKLSDQILKAIKKETIESCSHALADVNMLLNQAFLVEKKRQEAFSHALNELDSQFADLLNFRLVGPLPPYSFATVVVESLDEEKINSAKKLLKLSARGGSAFGRNGEVNKENVKKAYDKLAFKLHPDHGGNSIEFELITKGYKLLRKYAEQGLLGVYLFKWEKP